MNTTHSTTYHDIVKYQPDNVATLVYDANKQIIAANKQAVGWFGDIELGRTRIGNAWLIGQDIHLSDRQYRTLTMHQLLEDQFNGHCIGITNEHGCRWVQWFSQKSPINASDSVITLTDVSALIIEIQSHQQKAEDADTQDFATKLYNRRYAMERLDQMHHHAKRYQSPFAVAMLDIDHFKRINDTFGHNFGDAVLARLAKVIQRSFRETDLCARFGGEEFLILMPETDAHDATLTLDRLRQQVSELKWDQMQRPVTISSGVIEWQANKSVEQLIFLADQRLTTAKKAGRNQVCGDLI